MQKDNQTLARLISGVIVGLLLLVIAGMYGCPRYNVWEQGLHGEAELKRAEWNRQIAIKEALAKLESSKSLAQAEIERARGVAEANRIIGDSLKNNEGYLHYLWIHNLESTQNSVIYIPTETGMPILERRK
jgi:hypothetical protein